MTDSDVGERLQSVQESLDRLEREIANENTLRAKRIGRAERAIRLTTIAVVLAIVVGLGGVAVGVFAHNAANKAQTALNASTAATQQIRINACLQANIAADQGRAAEKAEIRTLTALAKPGQAATVAKFLVGYDRTVDHGHPLRDCTPAGIAKFYSTPKRP